MPPELRAAVFALPVDEKLKLVEDLWDSIQEDELPPLTEAQFEELERRRKKHEENPGLARPWEEVWQRLRDRYGC